MHRKLLTVIIALIIVLVLNGCDLYNNPALNELNPQTYSHLTGYSISVPEDWNLEEETGTTAVFLDPEGSMALQIVSEIGGMDYYSLDECAGFARQMLDQSLTELSLVEDLPVRDKAKSRLQLWQGQDEDGYLAQVLAYTFHPYDSLRYYVFLLAGGSDFQQYQKVFEAMISSFQLSKPIDEIYELLNKEPDEIEDTLDEQIDEDF
ncbi:MAG: hypothetical protein LBB91_06265 [Clostridiales bacterium]|jgi:hypothetical protein|nr:hypothetical protein [Clostridiales bacterium]